jgi:antitoxin component YwqK of YwqJK toxin-antitoxin module
MEGQGKLYYPSGNLAYEGSFSENCFNGLGKVFNENPGILN